MRALQFEPILEGTRLHFMSKHCPDTKSLPEYVSALQHTSPGFLFRVCDANIYDPSYLNSQNILVDERLKFDDGGVPADWQVEIWISFLENYLLRAKDSEVPPCIVVHCISGIGRAPLLVALAYIECNVEPIDAIEEIRKFRRGALNSVQVNWLCKHKRNKRLLLTNVIKKYSQASPSNKWATLRRILSRWIPFLRR